MEMLQQVPVKSVEIFTRITHIVAELHVSLAHYLFICLSCYIRTGVTDAQMCVLLALKDFSFLLYTNT